MIIAKMEEFIRNGIIRIYSSRLQNELKTFVWNNNKPEAMRSYNDDHVMALAIACWVRDTALVLDKKDVEYKKAFINSMTTYKSHLDTTVPGMQKPRQFEWDDKVNDAIKTNKKFIWLLKG